MADEKPSKYTTADRLAAMLDLSTRRIQQLRGDGAFVTEETKDGPRYVLVDSLVSYIKFLQTRQDSASLTKRKLSADVRIKEAKAEAEETKLSLLRNEVHRAEHVRILFSDMITQARSAFMDIPGRCAVDCSNASPAESALIIEREIRSALIVMSSLDYDPSKFTELIKQDGGITIESDEEEAQRTKPRRNPAVKKKPVK